MAKELHTIGTPAREISDGYLNEERENIADVFGPETVALGEKIVKLAKHQKGLRYDDAYLGLEHAYKLMKYETNFLELKSEGTIMVNPFEEQRNIWGENCVRRESTRDFPSAQNPNEDFVCGCSKNFWENIIQIAKQAEGITYEKAFVGLQYAHDKLKVESKYLTQN